MQEQVERPLEAGEVDPMSPPLIAHDRREQGKSWSAAKNDGAELRDEHDREQDEQPVSRVALPGPVVARRQEAVTTV